MQNYISLKLCDSIPDRPVAFIQAVTDIFAKVRNITIKRGLLHSQTSGATKASSPPEADVLQRNSVEVKDLSTLFESVDTGLRYLGRDREASVLVHALNLYCLESSEGGYGHSLEDSPWPPSAQAYEDLEFLIESWLMALSSADNARRLPPPVATKHPQHQPMTLAEKILAHHAFKLPSSGGTAAGDLIRVSVDWVIASELSWVGMKHSMTSIGATPSVFRNDRFWLAGDHTVDPRIYKQERVRELMDGMADAKARFRMTENQGSNYTILHTEFVRERAQPSMLVIGSDSHTCSAGAVSALAIGLGAADVMATLSTGETWLKVPESIRIEFVGAPAWYVRGKDVILYILKELKRNTYAADRIVEFGGTGAKHLSCDARFAISNMCTELGGVTGIFVPDEVTHQYISTRPQSRYRSSSAYFRPDVNASYAASFQIDLSMVESLVALYPSPDNVAPVADSIGMPFQGCFIGACTTTEEDLILAALVLEAGLREGMVPWPGKRIVVPGSLPIVRNLEALGLTDIYSRAGFERPAPGCSLCLGMGADRAEAGENWLSSQNRNFKNRMGHGAIGHICSAATVAASSFHMRLTDPTSLLNLVSSQRYETLLAACRTRASLPRRTLRVSRPITGSAVGMSDALTYMEPALSQPTARQERVSTTMNAWQPCITDRNVIRSGVYTLGDFVDTDAIIPATFILESPTDDLLGSHCLEFSNPDFREKVRQGMTVVVAGKAFGCGSSREEAPRALKGLGVQCVIAKSFSFIYARNQPNIGLLGFVISDNTFYEVAKMGTEISIDLDARTVMVDGQNFAFRLDEMELSLTRKGGLAAAYRLYGQAVFRSICEADSKVSVEDPADIGLAKRPAEGLRDQLVW